MTRQTRRRFVQTTGSLLAGGSILGRANSSGARETSPDAIPPHQPVALDGVHLYCDQVTIPAGETIGVHASATVPYELEIVRLGADVDGPGQDDVLAKWNVEQPAMQPIHPGSYIHVEKGLPSEPTGALTLECWVRLWNLPRPQGILTQLDGASGFSLLVLPNGSLIFFTGECERPIESPHHTAAMLSKPGRKVDYAFPPASWHHVVAMFDRGKKTIWLDGRLAGEWQTTVPLVPGKYPLRIGAYGSMGHATGFLDGDVAAPAIYARVLDPTEIKNRFTVRALTMPEGFLACWPLSEEKGDEVRDIGPEGHHGRVINHGTWMIGGPSFLPAVAHYGQYDPDKDWRRGHGLRLASDDLYDCRWRATHSFRIPTDARSGLFAARARFVVDDEPCMTHFTFVVTRNPDRPKAAIALLFSTNTWKAYSGGPFGPAWPGITATVNPSGHEPKSDDNRAPYCFYRHHRAGQPAYQLGWRLPWPAASPYARYLNVDVGYSHLARADRHTQTWLEREGYAYDAISDLDLHRDPALLGGYRVLMIVGHSEYWSREAMGDVRTFLAGGGQVICLSGNTMYWRVSFDKAASEIECRKVDAWGAQLLPQMRGECWHEHDHRRGGVPRDDGDPEWRTLGVEFATNNLLGVAGAGPFRTVDPDHFLFQSPNKIELKRGEQFGADPANPLRQPIGHETDIRVSLLMQLAKQPPPSGAPTGLADPPKIDVLAEGIVAPPAKLSARDYYHRIVPPLERDGTPIACEITYWQPPGGGRVFAAPSIAAGWTLAVCPKWSALLKNVLDHFGVKKA